MSEDTEQTLIHRDFDYGSIPPIVVAARDLQQQLLALQVSPPVAELKLVGGSWCCVQQSGLKKSQPPGHIQGHASTGTKCLSIAACSVMLFRSSSSIGVLGRVARHGCHRFLPIVFVAQESKDSAEHIGGLRGMNAVVEQRARLQALARNFADRAIRFMTNDLSHIADDAINRTTSAVQGM